MGYGTTGTIEVHLRDDGVLRVRLNRPEVHNAFNDEVIDDLDATFARAAADPAVRACLLAGNGPSFSAGADISWMRAQGEAGRAANLAGARRMGRMFHAVWACPKPVVARVHGAALGGGTGLTAVADVAVAAENATFGFPEVRLGILPAVISPYVIERIGSARARALFVLGSRFDGRTAERHGLVFEACPEPELDDRVESRLAAILAGAPSAVAAAKALTHDLAARRLGDDLDDTAERIAEQRGTPEGREGLTAFLDRRPASWTGGGPAGAE